MCSVAESFEVFKTSKDFFCCCLKSAESLEKVSGEQQAFTAYYSPLINFTDGDG